MIWRSVGAASNALCSGVGHRIIDDAIDKRHRRLHIDLRATGGHFEYSL